MGDYTPDMRGYTGTHVPYIYLGMYPTHKTMVNKVWYISTNVIVPTALYGAEAWGMRSAERRKVNVLEMKALRSLVVVSRMDRVGNEEVRRRAGIERELASRADQRVLRWFGHVERMSIEWPEGC